MSPTALRIALRYFFSKKRKNFIHILTNLSMLVVAVGTMALIIVLSTFNGLEVLTRTLHTAHNPEIKIIPKIGKTFQFSAAMQERITEIEGIKAITEVLEDNALLRYGDTQIVVKMKGVSENFGAQNELADYLEEGSFRLQDDKKQPQALLGAGVRYQLGVSLSGIPAPMVFWYPENKLSVSNPSKNFRRQPIYPGGVLAVEQQFDESHVLVPLTFARELTGKDSLVSSLEIKTSGEKNIEVIQKGLENYFPGLIIQNADEQQAIVLRAFKIERLFTFLAFAAIIAVASFNIFFSLAMLVIEKRKDLAILRSLGAKRELLRQIFIWECAIIAGIGTGLGLLLGFIIVFLQSTFGLVKLGVETSIVSAYPVELRASDFLITAIAVLAITLSAGILPARNASRINPNDWS
ncbi:MAG: FtsX-like permease family protein [Bacteroidota bacterium]